MFVDWGPCLSKFRFFNQHLLTEPILKTLYPSIKIDSRFAKISYGVQKFVSLVFICYSKSYVSYSNSRQPYDLLSYFGLDYSNTGLCPK